MTAKLDTQQIDLETQGQGQEDQRAKVLPHCSDIAPDKLCCTLIYGGGPWSQSLGFKQAKVNLGYLLVKFLCYVLKVTSQSQACCWAAVSQHYCSLFPFMVSLLIYVNTRLILLETHSSKVEISILSFSDALRLQDLTNKSQEVLNICKIPQKNPTLAFSKHTKPRRQCNVIYQK